MSAPYPAPLEAGAPKPVRVLVTGEYPPQPGGVSTYSRLVAEGLARAGEEVHVFAPSCSGPDVTSSGVWVHRLPGIFGPRALRAMGRVLDHLPEPRRLLLQYVPHAFGWKAMNVPLCAWLAARREPLDVMFHEVSYPWLLRPRAIVLASAHIAMAALLGRAVDRVYVSTRAWEPLLRSAGVRRPATWLPVPSNLPAAAAADAVARVRCRFLGNASRCLAGHFGTHGDPIAPLVARAVETLLRRRPECACLLVGRGSEAFRARWGAAHPELSDRLHATGPLPEDEAAAHLAACDLLLQPYPDGVTTRRGSLMAGVALGCAVVTNDGVFTEALWRNGGVALADAPEAVGELAAALAGDGARLCALREHGVALYRERFSLQATISVLHATWGAGDGAPP